MSWTLEEAWVVEIPAVAEWETTAAWATRGPLPEGDNGRPSGPSGGSWKGEPGEDKHKPPDPESPLTGRLLPRPWGQELETNRGHLVFWGQMYQHFRQGLTLGQA